MKKILIVVPIVFSCILVVSCLKDIPNTDFSGIQPIIIIPNANRPSNLEVSTTTYTQAEGNKEVQVYARVSWEKTLDHDLIVTFIKDQAAIDDYNTQFSQNFVMLSDAGYSMSSLQVTIPAHKQEAYIPITIKPDQVATSGNYMLAFTITDAQGQNIASNFKTIVWPIEVQ